MEKHETQFEAFVTNLGKYNEGELIGEWAGFPMEREQMKELLNRIGINEEQESYFITDYDFNKNICLSGSFGEHESLDNLNLIGTLLEQHGLSEGAEGYLEYEGELNLEQLGNLIVQQDAIEYFPYEFQGVEYLKENNASENLLYGYTLAEQSGIYQKLKEVVMENHVDYESYGRNMAINNYVWLMSDGYIDVNTISVDLKKYSLEELREEAGLSVDIDKAAEQQKEEMVPRM